MCLWSGKREAKEAEEVEEKDAFGVRLCLALGRPAL